MRRAAYLVCLTVALAGCAYHPVAERPAVALPSALGESNAAARWPDAGWWRAFGSPELDRFIDEAQARNQDLAATVARIHQQSAFARIAGAPLLPSVGLSGDVSRQSTNGSNGNAAGTFEDASLTASYELDLWGGNSASAASAKASLSASRFDRDAMALTVTADVADSYFAVLSARRRLSLAQDNLANARRILRQVEARARAGAALDRDVAEQQALVASQQAAIPALQQTETEALTTLALLLDRPPQSFSVSGDALQPLILPSLQPGLPSDLLTRRPDIASAEAKLAAADADVAAARAALLPHIDLSATGAVQNASVSAATGGTSLLYGLTASIAQTIFDNGALAGKRDYAIAKREELLAQYRSAVANALGDVHRALQAVDHLSRQEAAQERAVTASRRAFKLDQTQYRAGAEDLLNVLQTQRSLFDAEDQLARVRLAQRHAVVGLYKALGGGWREGDVP